MTLDPLDEEAIFNAIHRTLEKHKDISDYAAAVTAGLTILNLKRAPGRSETSVDPSCGSSIQLAALEVLQRRFATDSEVITRRKPAAGPPSQIVVPQHLRLLVSERSSVARHAEHVGFGDPGGHLFFLHRFTYAVL